MAQGLTGTQAELLANLVNDLRPDWGVAGLKQALWAARDMGSAYDVVLATVVAAATEGNRTPAVVPMPGPHWEHKAVKGGPRLTVAERRSRTCQVCGEARVKCREKWSTDHEFESIDDARARRARAEGKKHHE